MQTPLDQLGLTPLNQTYELEISSLLADADGFSTPAQYSFTDVHYTPSPIRRASPVPQSTSMPECCPVNKIVQLANDNKLAPMERKVENAPASATAKQHLRRQLSQRRQASSGLRSGDMSGSQLCSSCGCPTNRVLLRKVTRLEQIVRQLREEVDELKRPKPSTDELCMETEKENLDPPGLTTQNPSENVPWSSAKPKERPVDPGTCFVAPPSTPSVRAQPTNYTEKLLRSAQPGGFRERVLRRYLSHMQATSHTDSKPANPKEHLLWSAQPGIPSDLMSSFPLTPSNFEKRQNPSENVPWSSAKPEERPVDPGTCFVAPPSTPSVRTQSANPKEHLLWSAQPGIPSDFMFSFPPTPSNFEKPANPKEHLLWSAQPGIPSDLVSSFPPTPSNFEKSTNHTEELLRSAKPGGFRERVLRRCLSRVQATPHTNAKLPDYNSTTKKKQVTFR